MQPIVEGQPCLANHTEAAGGGRPDVAGSADGGATLGLQRPQSSTDSVPSNSKNEVKENTHTHPCTNTQYMHVHPAAAILKCRHFIHKLVGAHSPY